MELVRISVLKETDPDVKNMLADYLAVALGTTVEKAIQFALGSPTDSDLVRLKRACQDAGEFVRDTTGKTPALELVGYGEGGKGSTLWAFQPGHKRSVSRAVD